MTYKRSLLAAALFAAAGLARADGSWSVLPIPGAFYTPETSVGFVAMALGTWTPEDELRKPHMYRGGGIYTLKNQVSLMAGSESYLAGDRLRLVTDLSFARFPDSYFGLGPDADLEEEFTPLATRLAVSAGWLAAPRLYVGPLYRFSYSTLVETEEGGELHGGGIEGSGDSVGSGGGLLAVYDSRDRALYPMSGRLAVLEASGFPRALGSTTDWSRLRLDVRSYHRLFAEHVLALQALAERNGGDVPFLQMPRVGGDSLLRGYYEGRYRDAALLALQAEYRFPIAWRLGGVLFIGAAQVAPGFADMRLEDPKVAGGAGLRLALQQAERINLRVDFGLSLEGSGFYLQVTEAF